MTYKDLLDEHGRPLHSWRLLPLIGLRAGQHLPEEGWPITSVGNVRVKVLPRQPGHARRAHRTQAECPRCGDWFCAGHLHQHLWSCEAPLKVEGPDPDDFDRYVAGDR